MKQRKNILLEGKHGRPVLTDLFYRENNLPKPLVIFVHGYKGFKDWGCWNIIAETFAENGLFFVKFNFSHNGGTPLQPIDFPDLEAFGKNNFSIEMDDLNTVVDWLFSKTNLQKEIDFNNVTLIGHSRGGGIAILKASEDKRITRLITWAGVSDFEARFPEGDLLKIWKDKGVAYIENSRTKQQMPHYYQFYEDFQRNKDRFNIKNMVKNLSIPYLIIHGDQDETVSYKEAALLHGLAPKSTLLKVTGGTHTFGCSHPWESETISQNFQEVIDKSIFFIIK